MKARTTVVRIDEAWLRAWAEVSSNPEIRFRGARVEVILAQPCVDPAGTVVCEARIELTGQRRFGGEVEFDSGDCAITNCPRGQRAVFRREAKLLLAVLKEEDPRGIGRSPGSSPPSGRAGVDASSLGCQSSGVGGERRVRRASMGGASVTTMNDLGSESGLESFADNVRLEAAASASDAHRAALGQFLTPGSVARFMAGMFEARGGSLRLLDPGCGIGSLSAAWLERTCSLPKSARPKRIEVVAFELDSLLISHLKAVFARCADLCTASGVQLEVTIRNEDFIHAACADLRDDLFTAGALGTFDCAILNPPYKKLGTDSRERRLLDQIGCGTTNLYAAFLWLTTKLLRPRGEMVAITPRSFCNGPYFKTFRADLVANNALTRIHLFDSREAAFSDDDVLQENVIFRAVRAESSRHVVLSTSHGPGAEVTARTVPFGEVVRPDDPDHFIRIPTDDSQEDLARRIEALPCTLADLGLVVSTGRVVDFRAKAFLRGDPERGALPLIYPGHFTQGYIEWPRLGWKKPNALADVPETAELWVPSGHYVLLKRFSSKEERRRVVAAVFDPTRVRAERIGFENHLNYFHERGHGLPLDLAKGLAAFLNSSDVDSYFRQFNGHTQVNARDIRSFRFPPRATLEKLGREIGASFPDQEQIDQLVTRDVFGSNGSHPLRPTVEKARAARRGRPRSK